MLIVLAVTVISTACVHLALLLLRLVRRQDLAPARFLPIYLLFPVYFGLTLGRDPIIVGAFTSGSGLLRLRHALFIGVCCAVINFQWARVFWPQTVHLCRPISRYWHRPILWHYVIAGLAALLVFHAYGITGLLVAAAATVGLGATLHLAVTAYRKDPTTPRLNRNSKFKRDWKINLKW